MTDEELVAKKLAFIETCLRDLRELARPDTLAKDIRERHARARRGSIGPFRGSTACLAGRREIL